MARAFLNRRFLIFSNGFIASTKCIRATLKGPVWAWQLCNLSSWPMEAPFQFVTNQRLVAELRSVYHERADCRASADSDSRIGCSENPEHSEAIAATPM